MTCIKPKTDVQVYKINSKFSHRNIFKIKKLNLFINFI